MLENPAVPLLEHHLERQALPLRPQILADALCWAPSSWSRPLWALSPQPPGETAAGTAAWVAGAFRDEGHLS